MKDFIIVALNIKDFLDRYLNRYVVNKVEIKVLKSLILNLFII